MIDKDQEELPEPGDAEDVGSGEMAEALKSIKSAAPSLAGDIDAAQITPESLASAHGKATPDEPGKHAAAD